MTGKLPADIETPQLGYVYLVLNPRTGWFKIGSARRPHTRLRQLNREMRAICVMLHTIATNQALRLEREVQSRFISQHQGGEWFDLAAIDVAVIYSVCTVFYRDAEWQPQSARRADFDKGARWAAGLPVCTPVGANRG